jgi:hypothetical protein
MKVLKNSRGIAIVYVTLFLMVMGMMFLALGIDIGWMTYVRTQGQSATDASALAGAAAIPAVNSSGSPAQANTMATANNSNNKVMNQAAGIAASNVQVCDGSPSSPGCPATNLSKAGGVKVSKTYNTPLFFTRLLNGVGNTNISVESTAWLGGPVEIDGEGDLPVTLCASGVGYDPSAPNCLAGKNPGNMAPHRSGVAGWWNKDAPASAKACKDHVDGSVPMPHVAIGDTINVQNGQDTSCMKKIEDRFASCTTAICNGPASTAKTNCTVVLPIVSACTPFNQTRVVNGFVALCVTRVQANPASSAAIEGVVGCGVQANSEGLGGGPFFGVYADHPVLVK